MANKHTEELRKKKRRHERNSPFPVPIASLTGLSSDENYWYHFTGQLQNDSVLVTSSGDIRCLDRMGFFGRGMLSRGGPEFHKSMPHVYFASEVGSDPDIVSVIKRRMYLRHKQWQQLDQDRNMDQHQIAEEDLEFDSDIDCEEYQDDRQYLYDGTINNLTTTDNKDSIMCSNGEANNEQTAARNSRLEDDKALSSWDNAEGDADFWSSETKLIDGKSGTNDIVKKDDSIGNSWDNTGDSEFWTSGTNEKQTASNTVVSKNDKVSMSWDNIEADADFWTSEANDKPSDKHRLNSNDNGTDNSWENTQGDSTFWVTNTTETNGEQDGNVVTEQGDNIKSNCGEDNKTKSSLDTGNVQVGSDWDNSKAGEDFWGTSVDSKTSINAAEQPPSKKRKMEENSSTCDAKNRDHVTKNIDQVTKNNGHVTETDDGGSVATNLSSAEVLTSKVDLNQINENFDDLSHMNVKENLNAVQNMIKDSVNRTTNSETSQKPFDTHSSTQENVTESINVDGNVMQTERNKESASHHDNNMQESIDKHQNETTEKLKTETDTGLNSDMTEICDATEEVDNADLHTNCGNDKSRTDNTVNAGVLGHINEGEEIEKLETNYELNSEVAEFCDEAEEVVKVDLHPDCENDDQDADYLVIDDVDEGHKGRRNYDWQPVMKKDPFPYTEPLVLAAEEAFFLSYGLGCLSVLNEESKAPLTLKGLWLTFCKQPRFLPCYAAYHYLRSRGWVPKPGIIFGTDFILYKEGPPFFHASYSIVVKAVYSGTYKPVEEYSNRSLTWISFSGLHRVTEHVVKTLLICYVIIPPDLTEEEKSSPTCLSRLKIHLQKYNRWVSSEEREQGKVLRDMP